MPENRAKTGRFVAGKSGNPGGRPKIPDDIKEAYRALALEAVQTLADIMRHGRKDADRKDASIAILDRAYGKPEAMSKVELSGQNQPVVLFRWMTDEQAPTQTA